jgi:hypothetical protein
VCVISQRLRKLISLTAGKIPFTHHARRVKILCAQKPECREKEGGPAAHAAGFLPATAQISQVWRPGSKLSE